MRFIRPWRSRALPYSSVPPGLTVTTNPATVGTCAVSRTPGSGTAGPPCRTATVVAGTRAARLSAQSSARVAASTPKPRR